MILLWLDRLRGVLGRVAALWGTLASGTFVASVGVNAYTSEIVSDSAVLEVADIRVPGTCIPYPSTGHGVPQQGVHASDRADVDGLLGTASLKAIVQNKFSKVDPAWIIFSPSYSSHARDSLAGVA